MESTDECQDLWTGRTRVKESITSIVIISV